jgi:hypothetical protein
MRKALLALLLLAGPAGAQQFPPSPGPGYSFVIPYGGYPTYVAVGTSALATAGDVFCIRGSATRNVRIHKIGVSATATSAAVATVSIVLRSTANTGTSTPITLVALDQVNPAATAVAVSYDTAPTLGTTIGSVRAAKLAVGTTGNSNTVGFYLFVFEPSPILLRGVLQSACVNLTAVGAGASIVIETEHQETTVSTN